MKLVPAGFSREIVTSKFGTFIAFNQHYNMTDDSEFHGKQLDERDEELRLLAMERRGDFDEPETDNEEPREYTR